ncbi:MAG: IS110 family transposase [Anaerolineae bacterium]|nr:IS110 family transposase [Anaerolineae bacterium]
MEQFITTIPGIGPVTGATILAEIETLSVLPPAKLVAYAGIDPSGLSKWSIQRLAHSHEQAWLTLFAPCSLASCRVSHPV